MKQQWRRHDVCISPGVCSMLGTALLESLLPLVPKFECLGDSWLLARRSREVMIIGDQPIKSAVWGTKHRRFGILLPEFLILWAERPEDGRG